jgi:hypothetical protein
VRHNRAVIAATVFPNRVWVSLVRTACQPSLDEYQAVFWRRSGGYLALRNRPHDGLSALSCFFDLQTKFKSLPVAAMSSVSQKGGRKTLLCATRMGEYHA